jgi:outer membrane immunogenic protein
MEPSVVKKLIIAGLSLIASLVALDIGSSALAADVAVEPIYASYGVPVSVAYNWTGFYIGANVGGHFAQDKISTTTIVPGGVLIAGVIDATSPGTINPSGFLGGLQAGYNWQVGRIFAGLEVDGDWLGGTASRSVTFNPPFAPASVMTNASQAQFLLTVRPRVGAVLDRWLLYVTGGLAFETFITDDTFTFGGETNRRNTRTGEAIGGGIEYAVLDSWTLRLEYLYVTFGSSETDFPLAPLAVHHQFSDNVVRIGINHRFPVYWNY